MNPLLTANLRADRELKLSIIREKLAAAQPQLAEAINLIHSLGLVKSHGEMYSHVDAMPKDPRIKALANVAAVKIKALTEAHQTQIEAIYQEFREQVANIRESNAEKLSSPSVTSAQSTASQQEQ